MLNSLLDIVMIIHLQHVGIGLKGSHTAIVPPLSEHVRVVEAAGRRSPLQEYSIVCVAKNVVEISAGIVTELGSAAGGSTHTKYNKIFAMY